MFLVSWKVYRCLLTRCYWQGKNAVFFTSGKNRDRRMELSSYCMKSVSRNDLSETVSLVFFLVILRQFIKEFGKA